MITARVAVLVVVWVGLALVSKAGATVLPTSQWVWTPLAYPGASNTSPYGISGTTIVGSCTMSDGVHGFVCDGGNWRTLDYPGAARTVLYGISGGRVVGQYYTSYQSESIGCVYDGTTWTTLSPGYRPYGIWQNKIVGRVDNIAFLYDGHTYTRLNYPNAGGSIVTGVWGDWIIGTYWIGAHNWNFRYNSNTKTWQKIDPFRQDGTFIDGIDASGIVGQHMGTGWLLSLSGLPVAKIAAPWDPGSTTHPQGISGDRIVGYTAGDSRGFLVTVPEPASLVLLLAGGVALRRHRGPAGTRHGFRGHRLVPTRP